MLDWGSERTRGAQSAHKSRPLTAGHRFQAARCGKHGPAVRRRRDRYLPARLAGGVAQVPSFALGAGVAEHGRLSEPTGFSCLIHSGGLASREVRERRFSAPRTTNPELNPRRCLVQPYDVVIMKAN